MTRVGPIKDRRLVVQGMTADDGTVRSVRVNGRMHAHSHQLFTMGSRTDRLGSGPLSLTALAQDEAGDLERNAHRSSLIVP